MPRAKDDHKIQQIHAAALNLVVTIGFSALKMADVARAAGIATGTLYIYYTNKEELLNDLYVQTKKEITEAFLNPENQTDTIIGSFRKMWFAYFKFNFENPEKMLFVDQFRHSGLISAENIALSDALLQPLDDFLEEAKRQGLLKNVDNTLLKAHLEGSIHEIIKVMVKNKLSFATSPLESLFEMTWNGVRK